MRGALCVVRQEGRRIARSASRMTLALPVFVAVVCAAPPDKTAEAPKEPVKEKVVLAGETFELEVAADDASRTRGLMERESIDSDGGMIFIFPRSMRRSFWMKNCVIDIDLIFIDRHGRITALHEMKAEPPRGEDEPEAAYERRLEHYWSRWTAEFAIELRQGSIKRLDLKIGQRLELDLPRLREHLKRKDAQENRDEGA